MNDKHVTGPIQVFVVGFDKFNPTGQIMAELRRVRKRGLIRLIDVLFVEKDAHGSISSTMHTSDLSEGERLRLGAVAGGLIGLRAGGERGRDGRHGGRPGAGRGARRRAQRPAAGRARRLDPRAAAPPRSW